MQRTPSPQSSCSSSYSAVKNIMKWSNLLKCHSQPSSEDDVRSFEEEIQTDLPGEFRELLLAINGGGAKFDNTVECASIGDEIELSFVYPLRSETPEFSGGISGLLRRWREAGCNLAGFIPFGDNNGGGYFFLMLEGDHKGSVFYADSEEFFDECFESPNPVRPIPKCFHEISTSFDLMLREISRD